MYEASLEGVEKYPQHPVDRDIPTQAFPIGVKETRWKSIFYGNPHKLLGVRLLCGMSLLPISPDV
jgi:hypothetical protein